MKYIASILFLSYINLLSVHAQVVDSLNQDPSPKQGINQVAIKYYGIDFPKELRKELEDVELEFIYLIDKYGNPTLSEVNGVTNQAIIDSVKNKTKEIGVFHPKIRNGVPESSIYFLKLTYPSYKFNQHHYGILQSQAYSEAKLEDFEYLIESGRRIDLTIGGLANQFFGKPAQYLALGWGMKIDMTYAGKNKLIYGIGTNFYGNRLIQSYPVKSLRKQNPTPPTLLIGLIFGKWFDKFNIQGEIAAGVQNIIPKLDANDPDRSQLKGWSPGIVIHYPIKFGKPKTMYYYSEPNLIQHNFNLHGGIRYVKLSLPEATGMMVELGLSYRMTGKHINEYKLKDEFLNK